MKNINYIEELKKLPPSLVFTPEQASEVGVSPKLLPYYERQGYIEKVARGFYRNPFYKMSVDFQWEDLVLAVKSIPNGVVCLISALALYDLTEEIPRQHWIAVPHSMTAPRRSKTRIIRTRNIEVGKTTTTIGSETIPIFDRERTVIDSFRYLGLETAIKALRSALNDKDNKLDLLRLQRYAKELRTDISPYLMTLTT